MPIRLRKSARYSSKLYKAILAHAQKGVTNLFGRNIRIPVAETLILFADIGLDILQLLINALRFETFAGGFVGFSIPKRGANDKFAAELRLRTVDRNTAMTGIWPDFSDCLFT